LRELEQKEKEVGKLLEEEAQVCPVLSQDTSRCSNE